MNITPREFDQSSPLKGDVKLLFDWEIADGEIEASQDCIIGVLDIFARSNDDVIVEEQLLSEEDVIKEWQSRLNSIFGLVLLPLFGEIRESLEHCFTNVLWLDVA